MSDVSKMRRGIENLILATTIDDAARKTTERLLKEYDQCHQRAKNKTIYDTRWGIQCFHRR
jgi:hypothetical protein